MVAYLSLNTDNLLCPFGVGSGSDELYMEGFLLPTAHRGFSSDIYNEFLYRLSPETTLTVCQWGSVFTKIE